jgi:hypothetical protein
VPKKHEIRQEKLGVFVVHYSPLIDRKKKLSDDLKLYPIESYWITEKDVSSSLENFNFSPKPFNLNPRLVAMDRSNNSRSLVKPRLFARIEGYCLFLASMLPYIGKKYLVLDSTIKRESKPILELSLMHEMCLKIGVKKGYEWLLILEDDAILNQNIMTQVLSNLENLQTRFPAWYNISSGAKLGWTITDPKPNNLGFFRVRPWATRCSSGYLINSKFANECLSLFEIFGIPGWTAIDVIFQIVMRRIKAKVYWQNPPGVTQGSETGIYKSNFVH